MRWLLLTVALSACSFEVPGLAPVGDAPPDMLQVTGPNPVLGPSVAPPGDAVDAATPPSPPPFDVGGACDPMKAPCLAGETCQPNGGGFDPPGGYCTRDCTSAPCPTGSVCSTPWDVRVCLESCPAAGCRAGYVCCTKGWAAPGVCVTPNLCN
jgi:hypothetical protein